MIKKVLVIGLPLLLTGILILFFAGGNKNKVSGLTDLSDLVKGGQKNPSPVEHMISDYNLWFTNEMELNAAPGAAVAIVQGEDVVWLKGYGLKKSDEKDSVDIHTVFRLGSVSKGFASILAGILVEDSVFNWDDKVSGYLPDFNLKDTLHSNELTIRHILSHTTGLPLHAFTNLLDDNVPYGDIIDQLQHIDIIAPPGKVYSYQNVAYSLISDIIQVSTGESYNFLMDRLVFNKNRMRDASLGFLPMKLNPDIAYPHVRKDSVSFLSLPLNDRYYSVLPASGVNASISDMAKWIQLLLGQKSSIIKEETLKDIFNPYIYTPIRWKYRRHWKNNLGDLYYALGWRVFEYAGHTVVYHGGYVKGYRAEIAILPEEQAGIAVLFNSATPLSNYCIPEFIDRYFALDSLQRD
ncbi:MAG: beta-lactamase family protein [Bacteroidales bacterium]|nr:beta-lactamase family protein [Bacteroidales bacterium]